MEPNALTEVESPFRRLRIRAPIMRDTGHDAFLFLVESNEPVEDLANEVRVERKVDLGGIHGHRAAKNRESERIAFADAFAFARLVAELIVEPFQKLRLFLR